MRATVVVRCTVLLAILSAHASAQHVPARPFSASDKLPFDTLAPAERYAVGIRTFGVFSALDSKQCSVDAYRRLVDASPIPETALVYERATNRLMPVAARVRVLTSRLVRAMSQLRANGDSIVGGRHVCVGFGTFAKPNAVSYESGFIIVDPRILARLRTVGGDPDFADEFVYYHEFGHQLQFWSDPRFSYDATVRRLELQADCVAGTLGVMTRINRESAGGLDELKQLVDPVIGSARELGDFQFENEQHHGTPLERQMAVALGAGMVLKEAMVLADTANEFSVVSRTLGFFTASLTMRKVLDRCHDYIVRLDREQGAPWTHTIDFEWFDRSPGAGEGLQTEW